MMKINAQNDNLSLKMRNKLAMNPKGAACLLFYVYVFE